MKSSSADELFRIVVISEAANCYAIVYTAVYEIIVAKVKTDMTYTAPGIKKYKVAFDQFFYGYFITDIILIFCNAWGSDGFTR